MTIKPKNEKTKKRKIGTKVSTGAWWKSTSIKDESDKQVSQKSKTKKLPQNKKKEQATQTSSIFEQVFVDPVESKVKETSENKTNKSKDTSQCPLLHTSGKTKKVAPQENSISTSTTSQDDRTQEQDTHVEETKNPEVIKKKVAGKRERSSKENVVDLQEESAESPRANGHKGRKPSSNKDTKEHTKADSVAKKQPKDEVSRQEEVPKKTLKLLINAEEPEECRLALLEDGRLESIHVSTVATEQRKNNIYKAKVVAVEPSLQAAFIDYGTEKNGFLPFSEIHPEYFKANLSNKVKSLIEKQQWKKISISDVIEKGQELLAQVVKEEIGKKGANMTTFLSIPGRCVVLMPGSDSAGISRKISGEERRSQLRNTMRDFAIPQGVGWIVRTASVDISENDLARDVEYLVKLWADIRQKGQELQGVGQLYGDHKTVSRFLREHFDPAIEEILVDDRVALEQVKEFVEMLPKAQQNVRVRLHQGARPIFNQYSVEDQLESIFQPEVNLPSGGSIVINPTEALVAVDVNSGSTSKGADFEESIFQANLEAATELARQLRLRDLGGLIVVDFIDMRSRKHVIALEKQMKKAMKRDKAKVDFSRISKFGLLQISRQKLGAPLETANYRVCEYCKGRGTIRSVETLSLFYLRRIQTGSSRNPVEKVECYFPMDVASYLLNHKRVELSEMEKRYGVEINITARARMKPTDNEIIFHKKEIVSQDNDKK